MKKLIFRGPVQTASGYGVHARMLLRALDKTGKFDITVMSVPWGATPLIYEDTAEFRRIKELAQKYDPREAADPNHFDVSIQVSIPNEFVKMAQTNVGVTAGIEVDRVAPLWLKRVNDNIDLLVVPSRHSYDTFARTVQRVTDPEEARRVGVPVGTELSLRKPMYLLHEWIDTDVFHTIADGDVTPPSLEDAPDFNFLVVGLGMDKAEGEDRKNISLLIRWFCEHFKNNKNVGLVLKVSMVNNSPIDFKHTRDRIQHIKQKTGCGQFPRITLIHGRLSDRELASLYKHPKIKALITTTHGEGFGLPIIEAAACGLPVLATDWSGHLDFLRKDGKNLFVPLDYVLNEIPESNVWNDVMQKGSKYAYPIESDVKMKMAKVVLSYDKPKLWAAELAEHVSQKFTEDLSKDFIQKLEDALAGKQVNIPTLPLSGAKPFVGTVRTPALDKLTAVAFATTQVNGAIHALIETGKQLPAKKLKLFTPHELQNIPENIEVVKIAALPSVESYSTFVMKELVNHIDTEHCMIVQQDGYVINGSAWSDEFVAYDWIGAPWFWDKVVGNGGFSIRSKRLMEELAKPEYTDLHPEDDKICRAYRKQLEAKGFTWAPAHVADKFSIENQGLDLKGKYTGQLGWHGRTPFYGVYVPN
jgi:glycosyltransferase involved in cell wall biosynthesis